MHRAPSLAPDPFVFFQLTKNHDPLGQSLENEVSTRVKNS